MTAYQSRLLPLPTPLSRMLFFTMHSLQAYPQQEFTLKIPIWVHVCSSHRVPNFKTSHLEWGSLRVSGLPLGLGERRCEISPLK